VELYHEKLLKLNIPSEKCTTIVQTYKPSPHTSC